MLSSIHPLGEAGRGQRWWLTVAAHVAGAALGGIAAGAALGALGAALAWAGAPASALLAGAGLVAAAAAAIDAGRWPSWLWRPRRQVNEDWLTRYRGWVYGGGFGVQLGAGVTTIVTAAAVYAAGALAVAAASPSGGALVGATFGLVRGATVLAGRRITTADRLVEFHRALQARAGFGRRLAVGADTAVAVAAGLVVVAGVG